VRLRVPDRGERDERGAIAILTAFLAVAVLVVAALGVDITTQVNQRQKLHDTIDAAAHAGAYRLPTSGGQASDDALASVVSNYPGAPVPAVDFFCVVAPLWSGSAWVVDTTQIPAVCNPAFVKSGSTYAGFKCNSKICSIPCYPAAGDACNTIRVTGQKPVPFSFAPVIGINQGSTGTVTSVACKGSCGTIPPNPMDVAVVADRTGSMSSTDIAAMITGIKGMFQVMTPSQQYVALGTIGRSKLGAASTSCSGSTLKALSEPSTSATLGPWIPVPFSTDYLTPGTKTINASSTLVKAVECLKNSSSTGTHLASPMKYAARYLLGIDPNNLGSLPARSGTIRKAIIFETDGAPNESINGGSTALNVSGDIGSTATNNDTACNNFTTVAAYAKAAGILAVTVAYNVSTAKCSTATGSAKLVDTLAAAASPTASGAASAANFDCGTAAGRTSENADGDYFFCAASGTDMTPIFKTALGQLAKGIRLIQLPPP
jgi:Putative Flp pilus-assembly TadE/G-like